MVMESFVAIALATAVVGQTSNVTYQSTISTGLAYPARLAPTPGGGTYVTDPPMKLFAEYDAAGVLVGTHAIAEGAIGIAVHTDGRIFISRNDGTIGVYSAAFAFLYKVDPAPLTLTGPNDLAFSSASNELYTVDSGSNRVLVFVESAPATWTLARSWGMEGPGLGQFESPQAIAIDPVLDRVVVTDVDNFRVQVFNTTGIFFFKFGYRIMYLPATEVAWFARSEGLAVDACGNYYVADALMGTVRAFSSAGKELNTLHTPSVGYGTGAGQLRVPCDIMINSGKLYVADTNNGEVQVYGVTCTGASATAATGPSEPQETDGRAAKEQWKRVVDRSDGSAPVRAGVPQMPDNPAEIVAVMNAGEFREDLDFNRDRVINVDDLEIAVTRFGAGTVEDFLNDVPQVASQVATHDALVPPHITDIANRCGRCHSMDGAPGGMLTALGQENLCQSCHSAGKIAGSASIGAGSLENSHPWDEAADAGVSNGPLTGAQRNAACTGPGTPWECCTGAGTGTCVNSDLLLHLDSGKIRCGTCHDPHENRPVGACVSGVCEAGPFNGSVCKNNSECAPKVKFMREEIYHGEDHMASQGGTPTNYARKRMTVMDPTLCGECHMDIAAEWSTIGHADTQADPWSHYDWSMGNNWLCTGPGTPYAYCTGDGAGTAASASAAVCTGAGTPLACCTGNGTGTCTLPQAMCTGAGVPEPCCSGPGAGSCSDRATCRQCHSGNGFIDYSRDYPDGTVVNSTHRGSLRVIDCLVCHATHGESQDGKLLRIYDTVRLPTGQVFSGVGAGATCMACHNGRTGPPVQNTTPSLSTPHYLLGGVMLEGVNGVTFGYTLQSSNHTTNPAIDCTTCHMAPGPTSGPEVGKVGGHSFRLKDHESGFENAANACGGCHTGLTTVNRPAGGDYDGDGAVEGVQDEVSGLLASVLAQLQAKGAIQLSGHPYWDLNAVLVADRILVKNAIWNWEFVDNSGDLGVKNTGYAVGLLQVSYIKLTEPTPPPAWSPRYTAP